MNAPVQMGDGIRLLSGALFDYANPDACPVHIDDIAFALSNVCRFAGHLPRFYSVAQHAVNVSRIVAKGHEFDGLMHDTAEAFTNDLPTPLKFALPIFKELETRIEAAMSRRFGFRFPLSPEVRLADAQMLQLEKTHIKQDSSEWACLDGIESDHLLEIVTLESLTPEDARALFLERFYSLNWVSPAQAIEARRAETVKQGSVHERAVPKGCAQ